MKLFTGSTPHRVGATLAAGMPVRAMCVALCWFVCAVASAQVSVLCRTPADRELAGTLARLIAQPVLTRDVGDATTPRPPADAREGEWVTIDRAAATVNVYSAAQMTTLSRVLDAEVMSASPYAVALATAELLEFAGAAGARTLAGQPVASSPQLGIGVDLELQSQPGFDLSFVRPALQLELAWGRARPGGFWTLGVRGAGPGQRTLQVAAAAAPGARVDALSVDAAAQLTLGHALGRLALLTQLAVGMSYLALEAADASGARLGRDARVAPLFGAGVGFRYSVLSGFGLTVRGEAQWAGSGTVYRIAGEQVLQAGALRVSLLAGLIWEGALAQSARTAKAP